MSITVHNRLREMGIETDHRERLELDKELDEPTKDFDRVWADKALEKLHDAGLIHTKDE